MVGGDACLLVQKVGPYHEARFRAAAASGSFTVIEFRADDAVYAWRPVSSDASYRRFSTRSATLPETLTTIRPGVLVCVGYADPEIHVAMQWALAHGVPLVTCSDSTARDEPRRWAKERLKRAVVGCFSAGLAAGSRATDYLESLGLPRDRVFAPWDVVDNDYFAQGVAAVRAQAKGAAEARAFLCVARFVPKKNLLLLVEAYALHVNRAGAAAWDLVLSGSGPLEPELRAAVARAGLDGRVRFIGFRQYEDLPAVYAGAGALVLPSLSDQWGLVVNEAMAAGLPVLVSTACGCGPELLREGVNGFAFDPENTAQLAATLDRCAALSEPERAAMGQRSRELIADYSPEAFARGLWRAVACAVERPRQVGWLSRALVAGLVRAGR